MWNVLNALAIATVAVGLTLAPASAGVQIVPGNVPVREQGSGIKMAHWGTAVAPGKAMRLEGLQLVLFANRGQLSYRARFGQFSPINSEIKIELFAGSKPMVMLDFGRWQRNCQNGQEQRRVAATTLNPTDFSSVDRARIYILGGEWAKCRN
jgi:hypothetical protein